MDTLRKAIEAGEDAGKILFLSEKALLEDPKSLLATHCKAIALLHSNGSNPHKVASALTCFATLRSAVEKAQLTTETISQTLGLPGIGTLVFQHAYAFYRQNQFAEVVELLTTNKSAYVADVDEQPTRHLLAQSYYNTERFQEAADLYEALLSEADGEDDEEDRSNIITNLTACYAAMGCVEKCEAAIRRADEKLFEHVFNGATAAIERNEPEVAREMLDKAETLLCRSGEEAGSSLVNDPSGRSPLEILEAAAANTVPSSSSSLALSTTDREFVNDYALILLQRAYLALRFERNTDLASRLLNIIISLRLGAQTTAAIASVNMAAIKNHSDFFESYRAMKHVQSPALFSRLNRRQRRVVLFNTALLQLNMGKVGACKRIAQQLAEEHSDWVLVPLLLVAVLLKERRLGVSAIEEAFEKGFGTASSSPNNDGLLSQPSFKSLVVAQVRLRAGDVSGAIDVLMSDASLRTVPAVIATLCDLQMETGRLSSAAILLKEQCAKGKTSEKAVLRVAEQLIRADAHAEAIALLDAAAVTDSSKASAVNALRALAEASVNIAAAEKIAQSLSVPLQAVKGVEVDDEEVENTTARLPTRVDLESKGFTATSLASEDKRKSGNRRRPMRRPCKNLKPDAKIDYERWLPLSIRTYYKDLPERRKREMRRLRREEQAAKRKQAEKRKAEAAAAATSA